MLLFVNILYCWGFFSPLKLLNTFVKVPVSLVCCTPILDWCPSIFLNSFIYKNAKINSGLNSVFHSTSVEITLSCNNGIAFLMKT